MNLNEYQNESQRTAIYPLDRGIEYTALGLVSEAGEVAGKIKKVLRDKGGIFDAEAKQAIADELGDTAWYVAALARELGFSLDAVCQRNLDKLASRAARNTLGGSGDVR